MEIFSSLWLPIVAASVALWIYGALAWMVLPQHKKDFKRLPDDDKVLDMVRGLNLPPGTYGYPNFVSHSEAQKPEMKAKFEKGPMGTLSVWTTPNMGVNMALNFVFYLVACFLIAYLAAAAGVPRGAGFGKVMQVVGTAGVLAFSFSAIPGMIWFQANKPAIVSHVFDGVVMGLITGAVFALLWPK